MVIHEVMESGGRFQNHPRLILSMKDEKFTVIFLVDGDPPGKIVLLKRSPTKKFAPNFFTGIGGKVGDSPAFANEGVLEGAYRELSEETKGDLTFRNIQLKEFARCVYEHGVKLYYFLAWIQH